MPTGIGSLWDHSLCLVLCSSWLRAVTPFNPFSINQISTVAGLQPTLFWRPKTTLPANWREGKQLWSPKKLPVQRVELPLLAEATFVGLDAQCLLCHETYVTAFGNNVHKQEGCESCHGPASRHITTRGEGAASILSLNKAETTTRQRSCDHACRAFGSLLALPRNGPAIAWSDVADIRSCPSIGVLQRLPQCPL